MFGNRQKIYNSANVLIACAFLAESQSAFAFEDASRTHIEAEKRVNADGEEQKLERKGFTDRYKPEDADDKAYAFFVRILKRDKIPAKLKETYDNQKIELKEEYQAMFPQLEDKIEIRSAESSTVGETTRKSAPKAVAAEIVESIAWLKEFTKKLTFKFDLFGSSSTAPAPQPLRYGIARATPEANATGGSNAAAAPATSTSTAPATNSAPIGPIVAKENETDAPTPGAGKMSDLGKFQGGIGSGVEDSLAQSSTESAGQEKASFSLFLAQKNNYYRLSVPVGVGQKSGGLTHEFQAPVYQNMRLGRTFDQKGSTVKTSWLNILNSGTGKATMNLHYLHTEDKYSGEAVFQVAKNEQVTLETKTPSELKPSGNELKDKGAEYKVGYTLAI